MFSGQTTQEMVVKDALEGVPIPIGMAIVKFAGSDPDVSKTEEFYVYGTERVAMIVPNTLGTTPSRIQFNEATYFLTDHLGNTRVAYMDSPGSDPYIINAVDYYPYGKVLREYDNGAGDRYMTTQHERDRETGLDYRGARYYDSDVARFLSLDPLAAKYPMLSAYNYVAGNPIIFIDPDGKVFEVPDNFARQTVTAFTNYFYGLGGDARLGFMRDGTGNLQFSATPGTKEFTKMNNIANDIMTKYLPGGTKFADATDEQKQQALFLRDMLSPAVIDIKYVGETNEENPNLKPGQREKVENKVIQDQVEIISNFYLNQVTAPAPAGGAPAPAGGAPVPAGGAPAPAGGAPAEKKSVPNNKKRSEEEQREKLYGTKKRM